MEDLHFGQTRDLGILPEQIHDFIVLLRHAEEVMADISLSATKPTRGMDLKLLRRWPRGAFSARHR